MPFVSFFTIRIDANTYVVKKQNPGSQKPGSKKRDRSVEDGGDLASLTRKSTTTGREQSTVPLRETEGMLAVTGPAVTIKCGRGLALVLTNSEG